ncbi:zinc-dependent alcohol dehydrogenase family protein [Streptomyces rugosispiralis]|uniref:Zinc-dependent alcohol dehydrogenase family protein n=1 Tax=Streptomyces rugosispiralis TaxID=2967341 RepID=A0ABT1UYR7_9ACTN|nr:zinc-dependent alcohol dehydrogenase family protein [Streptomyces rugosispiralis]MCQ8190265.1 zinc-dependent alcohol dehydrogenase family protein [Streptomyces rugosispiralis]
MSRAVRFHQTGGPEVLRLEEIPDPTPGTGEVLIHTRALGLNRAESMFRRGEYGIDPVFPSGLGYEAAGVIAAVGEGVTGFRVGQAVSVVPSFTMTDYPVHGEMVLAPAHAVVAHPERLSFEEAASVWMQFVTAYGGLVDIAGVRPGDTVLISAASSSVGLAAIQVAHKAGARAIALTRTGAKRQQLLDAGADAVIATSEEDIVARVRELTGGQGARVIFDPVGGPALADLVEAAAHEAVIVLYGVLDRGPAPLEVGTVLFKHLTLRGFELFEITTDDERRAAAVEYVREGLAKGELTPLIDRTFPLDAIADAHRHLEAGGQVGKIVVTVAPGAGTSS